MPTYLTEIHEPEKTTAMTSEPNSATTINHLLNLPLELVLAVMDQLDNIYTLKALLSAFPDEFLPLFKTYSKSILNTIFWRPVRHYNDDNGVVYRWMIRELKLGYLFEPIKEIESHGVNNEGAAVGSRKEEKARGPQTDCREVMCQGSRRKARDRFILSENYDID